MMSDDLGTFDPLASLHALSEQRRSDIDRQYMQSQRRLGWGFVIFIIISTALYYVGLQLPDVPGNQVVDIRNLTAIGPTDLCPGDTLRFGYTIVGEDTGAVLEIDQATWRRTPPQTVLFSTSRRVILAGPVRYDRIEAWQVPLSSVDPLSLRAVEWTPGVYEHRIGISTTSRNTHPAIAALTWTIREDCP